MQTYPQLGSPVTAHGSVLLLRLSVPNLDQLLPQTSALRILQKKAETLRLSVRQSRPRAARPLRGLFVATEGMLGDACAVTSPLRWTTETVTCFIGTSPSVLIAAAYESVLFSDRFRHESSLDAGRLEAAALLVILGS